MWHLTEAQKQRHLQRQTLQNPKAIGPDTLNPGKYLKEQVTPKSSGPIPLYYTSLYGIWVYGP